MFGKYFTDRLHVNQMNMPYTESDHYHYFEKKQIRSQVEIFRIIFELQVQGVNLGYMHAKQRLYF